MPTLHTYIVKQEREVRIRSTNPHDAAELAEYVFADRAEAVLDRGVSPKTEVRITGLTVQEEF